MCILLVHDVGTSLSSCVVTTLVHDVGTSLIACVVTTLDFEFSVTCVCLYSSKYTHTHRLLLFPIYLAHREGYCACRNHGFLCKDPELLRAVSVKVCTK